LSSLRRALGNGAEIVTADATSVRIDAATLSLDRGRQEDGEFLEGLDLRSEPFDDWRREQTARLSEAWGSRPDHGRRTSSPTPPCSFSASARPLTGADDIAFATGLVIDLRTSLSSWRLLPVIGPEAIGWKTDRDGDMLEMARSVGASYVIGGAIRRAGDRIRVSASLTDSDTGHLIWAETFDGKMADIFEMQEAISRAVVARVTPEIGRAEAARIQRRRPRNMTAWHLLAQTDELERTGGEGYGTPESNRAQVPLLEEAIRIEPDFARA
jgi:TolB-like protein